MLRLIVRLPDLSFQTYTWDARGNLTHDGIFTYTFDAAGRMIRARVFTQTADTHDLYPSQTLEVKEHFIVAVYNKEDVDRSWGLVTLLTKDEVLARSIIKMVEWEFVATYTAGSGQ